MNKFKPMKRLSLVLLFLAIVGAGARAADINKILRDVQKSFERGDYKKAMKLSQKALDIDPSNKTARDYLNRCTTKITEMKLGKDDALLLEKEVAVDKQIQQMAVVDAKKAEPKDEFAYLDEEPLSGDEPATTEPAKVASAEAAGKDVDPVTLETPSETQIVGERDLSFLSPAKPEPTQVAAAKPAAVPEPAPASDVDTVTLAPPTPETKIVGERDLSSILSPATHQASVPEQDILLEIPEDAKDIVAQRDSVADNLRRRHLGMENIVEISERRGQIMISLYMNRLFLPYSDVLRNEAFMVLDHIASVVRRNQNRKIVFEAIEAASPGSKISMPDLPPRRCSVVFSYLLYSTYRPEDKSLLAKSK